MSSFNRRDFIKSVAALGAVSSTVATSVNAASATNQKNQTVMGLKVPAIDIVRVGFIGVGQRGAQHVRQMCHIDGVQIVAICDTDPLMLDKSIAHVTSANRPKPKRYTGNEYVYRDMLAVGDLDIVIISTPWLWHTPMAVDTMNAAAHAFVEVPAATTLEECWLLVDTAEKTQKNCMMMENVCYGRDELMVLNMVRKGLFGELLHGEAAYIHELRSHMKHTDRGMGIWRTKWHTTKNGNLYPTHGLGPISQYMGINRGDRFDFLTSMSSPALGRAAYAKRELPADNQWNNTRFTAGYMNTTMIKTIKGRSIVVQHDTTTPRPYSRHNLIQGVNGAFGGFPNRIAIDQLPQSIAWSFDKEHKHAVTKWKANGKRGRKPQSQNYHRWDSDMNKWYSNYDHPLWIEMGEMSAKNGGHGGMDFLMLWRMIYLLRNGLAQDQDVYDAAAWSAIFPISMDSVADRSNSKTIPDFTRGVWEKTKALDFDLGNG